MVKIDEQFIKEKINPVVGFIFNTARQLGADNAPDSMDMEYLRQGTEKVKALIEESAAEPPAVRERADDSRCQNCGVGSPEHGLVAECVLKQVAEQYVKRVAEELSAFVAAVKARRDSHGVSEDFEASMWAVLKEREGRQ